MTPSQKLLKNIVALMFKVPRNWIQKENLEMHSWCSLPLDRLFWCPACFFFFLFKDLKKCGPFFFSSLYWISYNVAPVLCFFGPQGMWEFSSLSRDWTHVPCVGRQSPSHWTREVPSIFLRSPVLCHGLPLHLAYCTSHKERKNLPLNSTD